MNLPEAVTVLDNFLSKEDHKGIYSLCRGVSYFVGGGDSKEYNEPSGMWYCLEKNNTVKEFFKSEIRKKFQGFKEYKMVHSGINCFMPKEIPRFHTDGYTGEKPFTILYYPNIEEYDINEGGCTEIVYENKIIGIQPKPNRILFIDSRLEHRATSFRSNIRYTVTFRFNLI